MLQNNKLMALRLDDFQSKPLVTFYKWLTAHEFLKFESNYKQMHGIFNRPISQ